MFKNPFLLYQTVYYTDYHVSFLAFHSCRQLHPKLLEGLDAALSALEPLKTAESQGSTEQLFLKAFRNSPGICTG